MPWFGVPEGNSRDIVSITDEVAALLYGKTISKEESSLITKMAKQHEQEVIYRKKER